MSKFTQTSEHGTVIEVWSVNRWVDVVFKGEGMRSFNYAEAVELADAITKAAEEIKPKPTKAERIREVLRSSPHKGTITARNIENILREDGPL